MNNNVITPEMLSINSNSSAAGTLLVLFIYVVGSIYLYRYAAKQAKKYKHVSLENVWFMKWFLASYKNDAKTDNANDIYITPLQAGFLLDENINRNHIIATILHFLDLGIIKLEKIYRNDNTFAYRFEKSEMEFCDYNLYTKANITPEKKEKAAKKGISISEIYIIDKIIFKYYNYINADRIFTLYDNIDDFSKLYNLKNGINERNELESDKRIAVKLIIGEFVDLGLYSYKENIDKTVNIIESKLYEDKAKLLLDYKDKLKNDTLLSERSIENIYLWGEHLIFGVTFGVCKASINDAVDIYEDKRKK